MGPWFLRDDAHPHRPGCSYETLVRLVERGVVHQETVLRGPSSRQFWTLARWCPGVAHLLGVCHSCQHAVDPLDTGCQGCGAVFRIPAERQQLGLGEVRFIPGREGLEPEAIAGTTRAAAAPGRAGMPLVRPDEDRVGAPDPVEQARVVRMERELRRARRWRTVWCSACVVLVLTVAGFFVARALDIEAGPVGRWLAARERSGGSGGAADAGDGIPPILTPRIVSTPAGIGGQDAEAAGGPEAGAVAGDSGVPGEIPGEVPPVPEVVPDGPPSAGGPGGDGGQGLTPGGADPFVALAGLRQLR
jgi:hypothetical protein